MKTAKHLVIADDDEDLVEVIALRCASLGVVVQRAYDAATALEHIDRLQPNLVILDVNMPSGNGVSLCRMMANDDSLRAIPVIIMTGRKDEETVRGCHDLLAYYVLKCPNVWARLEPLIVELLGTAPHQESNGGDLVVKTLPEEGGAPRVLCIDDDRDFSSALKRRLEGHGVKVHQAFSGMEGYRCAFSGPVQAIVMDYEMPDGNGSYLLRRLHENPVTSGIPVIALTGHRDKGVERQLTGLGAVRVISKSAGFDVVWSELCEHVRRPSGAANTLHTRCSQ